MAPRKMPQTRKASTEDLIRGIQQEATQKRLKAPAPKQPAAADEMWLMGGPETTAQGGWALASAKGKKKKGGSNLA